MTESTKAALAKAEKFLKMYKCVMCDGEGNKIVPGARVHKPCQDCQSSGFGHPLAQVLAELVLAVKQEAKQESK